MTTELIPVPPTPIGCKIWRNTGEMRLDEPDPENDPRWKQIYPSAGTHDRESLAHLLYSPDGWDAKVYDPSGRFVREMSMYSSHRFPVRADLNYLISDAEHPANEPEADIPQTAMAR